MDSQIMKMVLMTTTPPRKTVSLADCILFLVVFRTLNHFLLISRSNREINILHDYSQNLRDEILLFGKRRLRSDSQCYITTN